MTTLTRQQAGSILNNLGWRVNTNARLDRAILDFQRGWLLGTPLARDGILGPATSAALLKSEANRRAGRGTASAHFSFSEFKCQCGGAYAACKRIWIAREQIASLEKYRTALGGAVTVVSGCRCPDRNRAVGGVSNSQHIYGYATDIRGQMSWSKVKALKCFGAIGYQKSTGRVLHVDRRDLSGHNNGGSLSAPIVYTYAS
jgi:hypothetical protein